AGHGLRELGGAGEDGPADSSRGWRTWLYDDRGDSRCTRGPGTRVDRRRYEAPPPETSSLAPPRDWGSLWLPLAWVSYAPDIGLFVGGGMTRTRYGFRRLPYRSQVQVRAGYATDAQPYRAELRREFPGLRAPASGAPRA